MDSSKEPRKEFFYRLSSTTWLLPILLAGILLLGLVLRLWGIDFGLPHRYHIDEPAHVVTSLKVGSGELLPDYPPNSPHFWHLALLLEYGLYFLVGKLTGQFHSPSDLALAYQADPTAFYLIGRVTSALLGTVTIGLVYALGCKVHGRRAGLLAGLFLAVCFLHVRDSHFAVPDALVVLLVTLTAFSALDYTQSGRFRSLALAAAAGGLATGLKSFLPAFVVLPLALAPLLAGGERLPIRKTVKAWLVSGFIFLAFVGVGDPGLILRPILQPDSLGGNLDLARLFFAGEFQGFEIDPLPAWLFYLRTFLWGWGFPMTVGAIMIGMLLLVYRRSRAGILLLSFPLTYYVGISVLWVPQARYALPIFPFLALFAAYALDTAFERPAKVTKPLRVMGFTVTVVLLLAIPLYNSIRLDHLLQQSDTRTLAKGWIESHIPEGAKIAAQWHGPPLSTPLDPEPNSKRVYDVTVLDPFVSNEQLYTLDYYRENGFEYVIVSSFIYNLVRADPKEEQVRRAFYASLDEEAELLAEFKPYVGDVEPPFYFDQMVGPLTDLERLERPGPELKVYQVTY